MSLRQLKELVKQNSIKRESHLNLKELRQVLTERGIEIPEREKRASRKTLVHQSTETDPEEVKEVVEEVEEAKEVVEEEKKKPDYSRLKTIRTKPRRVKITDLETNEETEYQSMFAAGKALGHSSKIITDYHNKVYKDRYKVEILTSTDSNDTQV